MTTPDNTFQQQLLREIQLLLVPFAGTADGGDGCSPTPPAGNCETASTRRTTSGSGSS
jgi:hypothetical protein